VECGEGKYFCHQDQKCKPIPKGYTVTMPDGTLVKEAKYEAGASTYGKMSIRNKRATGYGGNAKSPDERQKAYKVRMKKHKETQKHGMNQGMDNTISNTYEEIKRDEYGDPIGGPKISKKQLKKNLSSNEKDEKIVRSEGKKPNPYGKRAKLKMLIKGFAEKSRRKAGVTSEGAAWTKKAGQNKEGGLNEKGRKSYERENPGSDLKAPSKKKGNKRRASFCARMKGMRKRQKPSNNTGDDRLSKSLRAWNCSYEWPKDKEMIETTSLKNELIGKAQEKHKAAKEKKKFKQVMSAGKAAKDKVGKDPRGVRALSKGKWGYVKDNKFKAD
jgi:hypothetical protein